MSICSLVIGGIREWEIGAKRSVVNSGIDGRSERSGDPAKRNGMKRNAGLMEIDGRLKGLMRDRNVYIE